MNALMEFLEYFGIARSGQPRQVLGRVMSAFAQFPYENITKIIKHSESGSDEKARRQPDEVVRDHINWGAGGTCFSLTSTLAHLLRSLGWRTEYILADRRYGQNTHSALLVWIDDVPHLIDPGFLIINPIADPGKAEHIVKTSFNTLILTPNEDHGRIELATVRKDTKTYRLTYKTAPVDEREFLKAWNDSFDWDMMRYPLLTRTDASRQFYLNGSRFQVSDMESIERREVRFDDLVSKIAFEFRMDPSLVERAISILKAKGEIGGKTSKH